MENNEVKKDKLIESIKTDKSFKDKIFYIFTFLIPVIIYASIYVEDFYMIGIILGFTYIAFLYSFFVRNKNYNSKIDEVERHQQEIDEYCVKVNNNLYVTKNNLIDLDGKPGNDLFISLDDIESVETTYYEYNKGTRVNYKNGKSKTYNYSVDLENALRHKEPINKRKLESNYVKDLYLEGDEIEGKIEVPGLNTHCIISYSNDDNVLNEIENMARVVKSFNHNDFSDAITSTLWAYRGFLKEYGYNIDLYLKHMPIDVDKDSIMKYVKLDTITSLGDTIYFFFEVPWEMEHGFSWIYKNKRLIYVGSGTDMSLTEKELNSEWNFAKSHHLEVSLSGEEKRRIEEEYQQYVEKNK